MMRFVIFPLMKKCFFLVLTSLLPLLCVFGDSSPFASFDEPQDIIVYNRILAKVNGKTISVIDVMKKMDLFLQRYYPEQSASKLARFHYYSKHWRDSLSQIIDQELMLADAEHIELKVSDAEVREEILTRFGPNIMATLDSIGVTYEEAKEQVYNEMVVHRIMWYRVHSKALRAVNPQDIKEAYRLYCQKNPPFEKWRYQVLSVRAQQQDVAASYSQRAFALLQEGGTPFSSLPAELKTQEEENVSIALSPELEGDGKNLSASHKEVLKNLIPGTFSQPIAQVSRADNSTVFRIFFLKESQKEEPSSFEKMAETLKDQLFQQAVAKETSHYIAKLRERLGYDEKHMVEVLPADFLPFAMR
jgi:hypothetical protein